MKTAKKKKEQTPADEGAKVFTEKEFEEFGLLEQSVFELQKALEQELEGSCEGLTHSLALVARG